MKTLKKSLCLILALVFVLGLCTIGAGAANFTDKDEINYEDAVTVMQGLGILVGYPDGTFQPAKTVTRAEAAKMIAYMMLGEKYAEKLATGSAFADVPETHWASKYVNFCASKGIIVGYGDGNYGPSDPVTGIQMAKMLLVAVGYGEMGEFVGSNWDVNAFSDAVEVGIFDDAETEDFEAPATREETALYVFNTLIGVDQMKWDVDQNKYMFYRAPFGETVWNLNTLKGIVIANEATGEDYTIVEYSYFDEDGDRHDGAKMNFAADTGLDLIGHQVEMYYDYSAKKDADKNVYYNAYLADDISTAIAVAGTQSIGALAKQVNYVETNFADVDYYLNYVKTDDSLLDVLSAGGAYAAILSWEKADVDGDGDLDYYCFSKNANVKDKTKNLGFVNIKKANGASDTDSGYISASTLVLDEDGNIISALKDSYKIGKVTSVDDEIAVVVYEDATTDDIEIANCYEGIAKGEYVTVTTIGTILTALPTTTKTMEITQVDNSLGAIFNWYFFNNYAASCMKKAPAAAFIEDDEGEAIELGEVAPGQTIKFYIDAKNSVFGAILLDTTVSSYIFVTSSYVDQPTFDEGKYTYYKVVKGVDAEGNEIKLKIDYTLAGEATNSPAFVLGATASENTLYKVSTNPNTGISKLTSGDTAGVYTIAVDASVKEYYDGEQTRISNTRLYLNENTQYIYMYRDSENKLQIALGDYLKLKNSSATVLAYCYNPNKSTETAPAVWVYGTEAPANTGTNYIYVSGSNLGKDFGMDPYTILSDTAVSPTDLSQFVWPTTNAGSVSVGSNVYDFFTLYVDGVSTAGIKVKSGYEDKDHDSSMGFWGGIYPDNSWLYVGFYSYTVDADGAYALTKVVNVPGADPKTESIVVKDKDAIYKGKLLVSGTAMDDIDLSEYKIVDLSAGYKDVKGYSHAIDSAEAMTAALTNGYRFAMSYMLDEDGVPTGTLYVTLSGFDAAWAD